MHYPESPKVNIRHQKKRKLIVVIHLTVENRAKRMPDPTVETTD